MSGHTEEVTAPRVHDFRKGQSAWGHALHAMTWRDLPPRVVRKFLRKSEAFARASVMVHCTPWPEVGERLHFTGKLADHDVAIVEVKPCYDPRDMFTLTLEFDRPPLSDGSPLATKTGQDRDEQNPSLDASNTMSALAERNPK